jgi:hypothetical protein
VDIDRSILPKNAAPDGDAAMTRDDIGLSAKVFLTNDGAAGPRSQPKRRCVRSGVPRQASFSRFADQAEFDHALAE